MLVYINNSGGIMEIMEDLKKMYQKYYDKELYIVGALDCFGAPHTPDNEVQKSYIDMLAEDLIINDIHVNYVNMHSIAFNKTWELKSIIDADYTKKEYYDLNLAQAKKAVAKDNVFPYPLHERFLSDYYKNPSNPNLKITSHLADANNPIFIYSCGQMNFHQYSKMRTNDIKQIIPEILLHSFDNLYRTLSDVKKMVDYLISINPSVKIYMFGVYPMFENAMIRNILTPFYQYANNKVSELCDTYNNVYFIDVIDNKNHVAENDVHPDFKGQCYMKNQVLKKILTTNK